MRRLAALTVLAVGGTLPASERGLFLVVGLAPYRARLSGALHEPLRTERAPAGDALDPAIFAARRRERA